MLPGQGDTSSLTRTMRSGGIHHVRWLLNSGGKALGLLSLAEFATNHAASAEQEKGLTHDKNRCQRHGMLGADQEYRSALDAASDYLEALKARGDWSDAEIIEFQRRIIEALLKREEASRETE